MHLICPLAGVGSQLQAFVLSKPKTMIKIAGKRIIDHIMERLQAVFPQGTHITFILGYKKRILEDYLNARHSDYFHLHFVEQIPAGYVNEVPFFSGIGDAISLAEENVQDDDCFIFFSDHLPTEDFSPLFSVLSEKGLDGVLNVKEVEDPQYYGVCELDSADLVKKVVEKPQKFVSNLAITWGYVFSKS
ncbi:MAG: nucleotidyltransferase family protein, partial [Promethearchaeota archaeon]